MKKLKLRSIKPRKKLGQHFLLNETIARRQVAACGIVSTDCVVEIGGGTGNLTRVLATTGAQITVIEIDPRCVDVLGDEFRFNPLVSVHHADALKIDYVSLGKRLIVVGNLPYNIVTELLFSMIPQLAVSRFVFMVQREVGHRMTALHNDKNYGWLSIALQSHFAL